MSNYFTTRNELSSKKIELLAALERIYEAESSARSEYIRELHALIKKRPNLTAAQYAAILGQTPEERDSIKISIGMMGYMTKAYHKKWKSCGNPICNYPTMPLLHRERKTVTRHFVEVDESGNHIGNFETSETKFTYSITE